MENNKRKNDDQNQRSASQDQNSQKDNQQNRSRSSQQEQQAGHKTGQRHQEAAGSHPRPHRDRDVYDDSEL